MLTILTSYKVHYTSYTHLDLIPFTPVSPQCLLLIYINQGTFVHTKSIPHLIEHITWNWPLGNVWLPLELPTLTSKCSRIYFKPAEIYQLNKCFNVPGKEGEFANKLEDAFFVFYSLDYARFPELVILPPANSWAHLQRKNDDPGKMNTSDSLYAKRTSKLQI